MLISFGRGDKEAFFFSIPALRPSVLIGLISSITVALPKGSIAVCCPPLQLLGHMHNFHTYSVVLKSLYSATTNARYTLGTRQVHAKTDG